MITWTFIINPAAGKARGRQFRNRLERRIRARFPDAEILVPYAPGQVTHLAAERKTDGRRIIVAAGGDGTVNEVVNGLVGGAASLGVVPVGSGNDFARMFDLTGGIERALERLRQGMERAIDVGRVAVSTQQGATRERYFVNGMGIGFDALVAYRIRKFARLRGVLLYLATALPLLCRYTSPMMHIESAGETRSGRFFLVAAGNGRCAGGGFYLTPDASLDDGLFDICLVDEVSPWRALRMIPDVMRGRHGRYPEVRFQRGESLLVDTDREVAVHADGEVLAADARRIEAVLIPGALKVWA